MCLHSNALVKIRSQIVTLKTGRGKHRKYLPYTFTEQGVAMLSGVLQSPRAVQVNIATMQTRAEKTADNKKKVPNRCG